MVNLLDYLKGDYRGKTTEAGVRLMKKGFLKKQGR
jgi:hypothetical protein